MNRFLDAFDSSNLLLEGYFLITDPERLYLAHKFDAEDFHMNKIKCLINRKINVIF